MCGLGETESMLARFGPRTPRSIAPNLIRSIQQPRGRTFPGAFSERGRGSHRNAPRGSARRGSRSRTTRAGDHQVVRDAGERQQCPQDQTMSQVSRRKLAVLQPPAMPPRTHPTITTTNAPTGAAATTRGSLTIRHPFSSFPQFRIEDTTVDGLDDHHDDAGHDESGDHGADASEEGRMGPHLVRVGQDDRCFLVAEPGQDASQRLRQIGIFPGVRTIRGRSRCGHLRRSAGGRAWLGHVEKYSTYLVEVD